MADRLDENSWTVLLERIRNGKCTPFLGAGASTLPKADAIAERWAKAFRYPFEDRGELARVAQFMALDHHDMMFPKDKMVEVVKEAPRPEFSIASEPHRALAELPLPIYITTNYDDFMFQALRHVNKNPRLYVCPWNRLLANDGSIRKVPPSFTPSEREPLVFHLHGHHDVEHSLVLTEDDYLDFLITTGRFLATVTQRRKMLPHQVERALTGTSLLFIGYRLADWNFRVLFRGLVGAMEDSLRKINVAVQLPPIEDVKRSYLNTYFEGMDVQVYWGEAKEFVEELHTRWRDSYG